MPREKYYRTVFFVGAIWNWLITISFAMGYKILFPVFGMSQPVYPVFFLLFLGICFVFGIGYYWVSKDIFKNHDIIRLGIIAKLYVFGMAVWAVWTGQTHFIFLGAGVVDLFFAALYVEFLLFYQKAIKKA